MLYTARGGDRSYKVKIEIELTEEEAIYLSENCIGRVMNSVMKAVPGDYEHFIDLEELNRIMEPLRMKLANAIFQARIDEVRKLK
jgi:hypothetical protein